LSYLTRVREREEGGLVVSHEKGERHLRRDKEEVLYSQKEILRSLTNLGESERYTYLLFNLIEREKWSGFLNYLVGTEVPGEKRVVRNPSLFLKRETSTASAERASLAQGEGGKREPRIGLLVTSSGKKKKK